MRLTNRASAAGDPRPGAQHLHYLRSTTSRINIRAARAGPLQAPVRLSATRAPVAQTRTCARDDAQPSRPTASSATSSARCPTSRSCSHPVTRRAPAARRASRCTPRTPAPTRLLPGAPLPTASAVIAGRTEPIGRGAPRGLARKRTHRLRRRRAVSLTNRASAAGDPRPVAQHLHYLRSTREPHQHPNPTRRTAAGAG